MLDFERLRELLEKADDGADCGCHATTLAYLKLAQAEAYRLAYAVAEEDVRRRLLRAAQFSDRKSSRTASFCEAAHYASDFWQGFENGWNEHTLPGRVSNAFKIGRRFALSSAL